jgi:transcriptional regulator with XRE-family HTH domain
MKSSLTEKVFRKANDLFEESGMTLEELGVKMGYAPGMARKSAWAFLKNTSDPRLSTLEAIAKALAVEVKDLFE